MIEFRQSPKALSRSFADRVILATPDREGFHQLLGTSAVVWDMLDRPQTLDELCDQVGAAFDVDAQSVSADIEALLQDLANLEFVYGTHVSR